MNEIKEQLKSFSDSNICRNEEASNGASQKSEVVKIKGTLTSRIETREKGKETYYYGFFKLEGQKGEIPVVFKSKPEIPKGSQVELTGKWANSCLSDRQSFTCSDFKIITGPPEITTKELREQIQALLTPSQEKKKEWSQTVDFFFRKLEELKKIEQLSKLGKPYLTAYFLTENARYANYQTEHLESTDFNRETYLARIASELEITKKQMLATGWKEVSN